MMMKFIHILCTMYASYTSHLTYYCFICYLLYILYVYFLFSINFVQFSIQLYFHIALLQSSEECKRPFVRASLSMREVHEGHAQGSVYTVIASTRFEPVLPAL